MKTRRKYRRSLSGLLASASATKYEVRGTEEDKEGNNSHTFNLFMISMDVCMFWMGFKKVSRE